MNNLNNLYFYVINTGKLSEKTELDQKHAADFCYSLKQGDNLWIFAPNQASVGGGHVGNPDRTKKTIGNIKDIYLKSLCSAQFFNFKNMFFGIHGADWGISDKDYKSDSIVLEDFNDKEDIYKETIEKTHDFVERMKRDYGATNCIVKVFSHTGSSSIYTCFHEDFDNFITATKQTKILQLKKKQTTKDSSTPVEYSFDSSLHKSEPKIKRLETLFFEFRLCLATLNAFNALNDNENRDLWEETVERMIVLLKGGTLKRAWTENIIVETELAEKGYTSLKDNHYTEELKIPGIGHYVQLYGGETSQIQKCIELLWNKESSKDELIKNLKEVGSVIKNILEAEQKKPEESK